MTNETKKQLKSFIKSEYDVDENGVVKVDVVRVDELTIPIETLIDTLLERSDCNFTSQGLKDEIKKVLMELRNAI